MKTEKPQLDFTGKIVLVTGAAQGIGREVVYQFAAAGARMAVHYHRNLEEAEKTMREIGDEGHTLHQADITDPAQAKRLIDEVREKHGRLDVLVNNAAIFVPHPIATTDYDDWQDAWNRTIAANLTGPVNVTYCAARLMIERGGGRIVNVSSRGAFRGEPTSPAYGASKAGLNAMSQSLAQALAPHNVFVSVVAPGFVDTERVAYKVRGPEGEGIAAQSPLNRVARVDEVARAVLFLASEGTDFLTGCIVDINGASYLRS